MDLMSIGGRLKHAWNAFTNRDPTGGYNIPGTGYARRPDRIILTRGNERSIVTSVMNRIALDVSRVTFKHCRVDENDRYKETIKSGLNDCLNVEANLDQSHREFVHDVVMSMLDEGCVAVVPIDTTLNPKVGSYDIKTMRTGKVLEWKPSHVKVRVYNEQTGRKEEVWVPKKIVTIIENPFRAVMNEPNSTGQRLMRKLSLLDVTDEKTASGKLDLIVQLPYSVKGETRQREAERRLDKLQAQLTAPGSYGIAYVDATEKITQLNRPIENNLLKQIEYLTNLFFSQLGISQGVLDGTADEDTMTNYYTRIVDVIVMAIVDGMKRKFLTKTARTQGQSIMAFRDPLKLVPISKLKDLIETTCRNEITSSNEWRSVLGLLPSDDPKADELVNSNMPQPEEPYPDMTEYSEEESVEEQTIGDVPISEL